MSTRIIHMCDSCPSEVDESCVIPGSDDLHQCAMCSKDIGANPCVCGTQLKPRLMCDDDRLWFFVCMACGRSTWRRASQDHALSAWNKVSQ